MGKVVTTVLIVAVAVAVVVFAPQIAAAIGASGIFGATVTAATLATITSSLVGLGVSLGLAAVASVFRKVPNMSQSLVDRLNTSVVPSAPRKIIIGTTAAGADVRFLENFDRAGSKKDGFAQIVALASHRINAVKQFYLEDTLTWNGSSIVDDHDGGVLAIRACLEGKANNGFSWGSGSYWTPQHTFTGCAYLATRYKLDSKAWPSGIPSRYTTIVEGCPLYDPRRDSTNGGSGAHRIVDQSTWTFREGSTEIGRNPALAMLVYLLGYRINGKLAWGMGIPAHRIDFDNFRAYANLCEERVLTQSGGTVQRYTADGSFSTADTHETVISGITAAMGSCKLVDTGGLYQLVGGYDDTIGPKVDFDQHDIVAAAGSASPYTWKPAPATRETYNIARGRFADPANLYQLVDWGVVETDPLADGIPRTMSLDLGLVSRAETCQRIAKQFLLREALAPGVFSATFGPKAFAVQVGSLLTLSLPERGWNRKLFRVQEQVETHDLFFSMVLREESADIYAWDREEKPLPANIRPSSYDPRDKVAPANLTVTSDVINGAGGQQVSEVEVTWTPADSARVAGIQIESRPVGAVAWTEQAALHDPVAGVFRFTSNVGGTDLAVRARYRMDTGVYSDWVGADVISAAVEVIDGKARDDASTAVDTAQQAQETANAAVGATATLNAKFDQMAANVVDANAAIEDLVETYGSTATAAASASAAQIAASAAQTSADTSQTASGNAATAKAAAEQAENDAVAAKTAAETARSQALTAATNAGTANTNAQAAKTAAQTAKADAEAAFANSTTAKNAAVAAQGAAETARNNAQTYASNASNSATAAAGSASTASAKATESGNSSTAAAASAVSASSSFDAAKVTAASLLPSDFMQDGLFWSHIFTGAPGSQAALSNAVSYVDVANVGRVAQMIGTSTYRYIAPLGAVSVIAGRTYRLTMSVRATSATTPVVRLYGIYLSSSYGQIGQPSGAQTLSVQNQWYNISLDVTADAVIAANGAYLRPLLRLDPGDTHTIQLAFLKIEDVTSPLASAASANAASTSASAAATSATDAGTSASAAQTSATTATTQAGKASTSATNAATSETNAKGAENAAKTSQTAAATSATNAGNSATAAATSASTASSKATEASQSASTATTQANTAATKAGEASTSASNAAISETTANASKNAASISATNAANSATAAGGSASAASGSASNAQTSATNAGNSASSAAVSSVSATSAAIATLPYDFTNDGQFFCVNYTRVPSDTVPMASFSGNTFSFADIAAVGRVLRASRAAGSSTPHIAPRGWIKIVSGHRYRVTTQGRITSGANGTLRAFAIGHDASGKQISAPSSAKTGMALNTWYDVETIIDADDLIAEGSAFVRPLVRLDNASTDYEISYLRIEDITESTAAAGSASAAATSASAAGTSATNAGNSANSATQSANTASTKANEASNSATSAASSASSASSSSTNASNSATAANSSDVSAMLSAAAQMPSDFQQEGKFWQNGFGGLPQTVSPITANSIFSFQNGGSEGRVMRVTSSSQIDVGNIGMLPLQADRLYRFTARVRQLSGPLATLQLYRIGISATGGSFGNGTVASGTMTALNEWRDFTGTIASNTVIAMIAAGAANIRTLLRLVGSSSTVVVEYSYIRIEDITESTNAAGSASAAANSASQASASQSAAGSSASSAQTSATNAATSAGQASTSASNASTSANNAAGSANTASTQATNASNSANAASGSATSANNSAAAASTSASNAGNSATTSATQALYAASRATGNFVAKSLFEDGNVGSWISTVSVTSYSNGALGTTKELRAQARDSYEDIWVPLTSTNNRTLRLSGYARCGSASAYAVRVGVHGLDASNTQSWMHAPAANAGTTTWTAFNTTIVVPANVVKIRPFLQSNNDAGMAGSVHDARIVGLTIEDVTESAAAAGSASAAAISASQASASQSVAGSSASSATNSANSAATQANNASSSASAAAGSASSAATSSSNAGSSASSASNSANTASTKAGEASSSASAAAGSASTASAAASTATTQANLAATYSTGGGNLLPESSFEVGVGNWEFYAATGGTDFMWARDLSGDSWRPTNEHNLGIRLASGATDRAAQWATPKIAVAANTWYEFSGYLAAHRCNAYLRADWYDSANAFLRSDISNVNNAAKSGGPKIDNWMRCWSKVKAPATAAYVYFIFIKDATISGNSDSYAWLCRPMLRETYEQASGPSPYAPASGRATQALQQAEINTAQTALATANASIANLNTNVSTLNSSVNVQQTAINNLNGKTAAYWQVNAVAGGRAQLTVYADSNGGGGVDIVGDLRVTGNALITGTVNPEALALSRFVKRVGPVSISATNNTGVLYSATLGETMGNGSYLLEGTVGFTYSSGRSTTTYNGRPLYTDYANDGGVNVLLKKNGNVIASTGWSGNLLTNYGSLAYGSAMTTVFDAPAADTYTGNVTVEVVAFKGSTDTGIVNQGDYYTRTISGNYTNFNFSNLKLKWTFI